MGWHMSNCMHRWGAAHGRLTYAPYYIQPELPC